MTKEKLLEAIKILKDQQFGCYGVTPEEFESIDLLVEFVEETLKKEKMNQITE